MEVRYSKRSQKEKARELNNSRASTCSQKQKEEDVLLWVTGEVDIGFWC